MRSKVVGLLATIVLWVSVPVYAATVTASHTPWSGYWWPMKYGGLLTGSGYNGLPSPLDKYQMVDGVTGVAAKNEYAERYYLPEADSWWGMCWEWALAASVEDEPYRPSVIDNIPFRVGDKKGLLTFAHSRDIVVFGAGSDPVVFHSWLKEKIQGLGRVIVADLDAGKEVWSYPIFKYNMTEQIVGNYVYVTCTVFYPDDFVRPDYVGMDLRFSQYTYTLSLDGHGNIVSGVWTGSSVTDHPDRLSMSLGQKEAELSVDLDVVRRIATSQDDEFEGVDELWPGTYLLALGDGDSFALKGPESAQDYYFRIKKDNRTDPISATLSASGGGEQSLTFDASGVAQVMTSSAHTQIALSPAGNVQSGLYTMVFDSRANDVQTVPYLHGKDAWLGVALTGKKHGRGGMILGRSMVGDPYRTNVPEALYSSGQKRTYMLDLVPTGYGLLDPPVGLDMYSGDGTVSAVVLAGGQNGMLAAYGQGFSGKTLVSPGATPVGLGYSQYSASIRNRSFASNTVRVRSYSTSGQLNDEAVLELAPRETRILAFGNSPFYRTTMRDWLFLTATEDIEMLGTARSGSNPALGENFYATPPDAQVFHIPHVPVSGGWSTILTVLNSNETPTTVLLLARPAGNALAQYTVAGRGRLEVNLGTIVGMNTVAGGILEIKTSQNATGYITYVSGGDVATLPLLRQADAQQSLQLPHTPTFNPWWTGLAIANVSNVLQTVFVTAYDSNGNVMPVGVSSFSVMPGTSRVCMMKTLLGAQHASVGSVVLSCQNESALIGFYLIGNNAKTMLTGNNFQ